MKVKIKRHGLCEFVGFSKATDKGREKGYKDNCVPLFNIPGYVWPQCVPFSDILENFPIDAWCIVSVDGKKEIRKAQITTRYKSIGTCYYLSEHNANLALKESEGE